MKEEEIIGLLTGKIYEDYAKHRNYEIRKSLRDEMIEIGRTLSITKSDVCEYVMRQGFLSDCVHLSPKTFDGLYLIKRESGSYSVYDQERGGRLEERSFNDYGRAVKECVERLVGAYFLEKSEPSPSDPHLFNEAISIYLGDERGQPGVRPEGRVERLKEAYPSQWEILFADIEPILKWISRIDIDWSKEEWPKTLGGVEMNLRTKFPWLSDEAIGKLCNYFAYFWR